MCVLQSLECESALIQSSTYCVIGDEGSFHLHTHRLPKTAYGVLSCGALTIASKQLFLSRFEIPLVMEIRIVDGIPPLA